MKTNPKKVTTKKATKNPKKTVATKKNIKQQLPPQTPPPWDKQPEESTKSYKAYCIYQNMGVKRSLVKTSEKFYGKNTSNLRQIDTWSSKFNWVARVGAWEVEQERIKQEAHREALEKMAGRHARAAKKLQTKALKRLKEIKPEELNTKDTLNYIIEAAKLERSALGAPDHKIEHSGQISHTNELDTFIADDPEIRDKVNELLQDIAKHPGRVRTSSKPPDMDTS